MVGLRIVRTALLLVVVMGVLACAPPARPGPVPSTGTPSVAPAPATTAPTRSAEQSGWSKVLDAARREGKLMLYTGSERYIGENSLKLSRALTERFGVTLEVISAKGASLIERMKTEQRMGQVVADVFGGSPTHNYTAKTLGLLTNVSATLPALQEKDVWIVSPQALDTEGTVLVNDLYPASGFVNSRLLPPGAEPGSWQDILDPKWKGKMAVTDPRVSPDIYSTLLTLTKKRAVPAEFVGKFFAQNLIVVTTERDGLFRLAAGEYPILISSSTSTAATFAREGAPIKILKMREGTIISNGAMATVMGGPHPNASRVFLNWLFSAEGQALTSQITGMDAIRKGIPSVMPPALRVTVENPLIMDLSVREESSKMFQDKAWVPLLVK